MRNFFKPLAFSKRVSLALLLLRIVAGSAFMYHGFSKIQNPLAWMGPDFPSILQLLAAVSEFGGGLAWILGLLTPLASLGIAGTMGVATWMHANVWNDPFVATGEGKSYELALVFFSIAVLLFFIGPGRFSLDRLLFGEKNPQ